MTFFGAWIWDFFMDSVALGKQNECGGGRDLVFPREGDVFQRMSQGHGKDRDCSCPSLHTPQYPQQPAVS